MDTCQTLPYHSIHITQQLRSVSNLKDLSISYKLDHILLAV